MKSINIEEKGITLIALVITVIVLLILAGTAISIAINGSNIFEKANTAVERANAKAQEEEDAINEVFNEFYNDYNVITGGTTTVLTPNTVN